MTCKRSDIEELLRYRYEFTKERFGDATVDAWWDLLGDLDPAQLHRRVRDLVRGGADKIPAGLIAEGLTSTKATRAAAAGADCAHDNAQPNGRHSWPCPNCSAELLAAHHPRAIAAYERSLTDERARRTRLTSTERPLEGSRIDATPQPATHTHPNLEIESWRPEEEPF
jgi:hypothetical protein